MFESDSKRNPYVDKVYALTSDDVQRIWALLSAARDAIGELLDYRSIDFTDGCEQFPCEDEFYNLSSKVLRDCQLEKDSPF